MKIIIVCSRLCYGGAERVAVMWANGFIGRGHDVLLASNFHDDVTYEIDNRIRSHGVFPISKNKVKKWLGAFSSLRRLIKAEKPDVVIGVMSTCSLMAKLASVGTHCCVIATEHNSFERPESAPMTKYGWFSKFVINKAYSGITVLTEADKRVIGNKLRRVFVLPNPLAIEPQLRIPLKERIILAAGRLDDWHYKGFDLLIKAWSLINGENTAVQREKCKTDNVSFKNKDEGWRLQIAGTGSEDSLQYLKQLCKENGVEDSVVFLGFRTDIEELYKQSEIFVLSSRYEGFGLVLIEAMSQGCACIACDYKGRQKEILCPEWQESSSFSVDALKAAKPSGKNHVSAVSSLKFQDSKELESGTDLKLGINLEPETTLFRGVEVCENGILCEPDEVDALANCIKIMIENEEYREKVQVNAIERSKYYSIENTMDRWEEFLNRIVN